MATVIVMPTASTTEAMLTKIARSVLIGCMLMPSLATTAAASELPSISQQEDTVDTGLKPGDVIRVRIWREPELSGDFIVDARSSVVLPLLGAVEVENRTAEVLIDELLEEYSKYLRNPSIQISVLRRVSVQGEVRNPGLYPVDATISVSDVLAIAGGLTRDGNSDKIYLLRNGTALDVKLSPDMVLESSPILSGDQIFVEKSSWLSRNSAVIAAATITAAAIIIGNAVIR